MSRTISLSVVAQSPPRLQLHEKLVPFRGPWHLPWIIERYFRAARSGFTVRKLFNASMALTEMQMGRTRVRSRPFLLRIEPTNVCNLQCPLCLCGTGEDPRPKGMMSIENYRSIFEQTKQWAMITRLDGLGEPTIHPKIWELIRIAKSYGTSVVMHTNFNTPNCAEPEAVLDSGIDRLVISVDGASQETHSRYRIGGDLEVVLTRLRKLVAERKRRKQKRPVIEMQTVDFDFNRAEQAQLRELAREIGTDRYQVTEVQASLKASKYDPQHPRRCAWLWSVLTVAWNLDYRSCTNAWSVPWPRHNLQTLPPDEYWNDSIMREARQFNIDKSSKVIADDKGCRCNRCHEMMVIPLKGDYTCD